VKRSAWLAGALLVAGAGLGAWYWRAARAPQVAGVAVAGGDAGGLPRATPAEEGFEAAALQAAVERAMQDGAQAVLISHHGHLVVERYAHGVDAHSTVQSDEMARLVLTLAAGTLRPAPPSAIEPGFDADQLAARVATDARADYAVYLSRTIWQPVNAAPARLLWSSDGAGGAPALHPGCCFEARISDWLRVAALLLDDGSFEGTQVLPKGWAEQLTRANPTDPGRGAAVWLASSASGSEPFAIDGVSFLRGRGRTHLWMVPRLDLAIVLIGAPAPGGAVASGAVREDETRMPNAIIRALGVLPGAGGARLGDVVPGH